MARRYSVAPIALLVSWPAAAGMDKPWQELGDSSGGESVFTGLVLLALGYGAWRLFVSGELAQLLGAVGRFLLAVYLPVALFLGVMLVASLGLQSAGVEKDTAGLLALLAAGGTAWAAVHFGLGKKEAGGRSTGEHRKPGD
jgi:hypothetical protein